MISRLGVIGAAAVLLAIPLALLSALIGADPETSLHLFIGLGFVLVACAVFGFEAPRWVSWVGCIGIGALGAIFVLQGVSDLLGLAPLHEVAYTVLGQLPERIAPDLFILWCGWVAWHSRGGRVRLFGLAVFGLLVGLEALDYVLRFSDGESPGAFKLFYLLPFVWLLIESATPRQGERTATA